MEHLMYFVDFFLHLDKHLFELVTNYGTFTYLILWLIVFCETGLVVTPILPGDSLLFAAGALAAGGALNLPLMLVSLFFAAVLGDAVNYHVGRFIGPKVFERESRIFKKKYLDKTRAFYERYGGKTIVLARFVPIVRTFAPFLAGVGIMSYPRFLMYNVTGAAAWIGLFLVGGYFFGQHPAVKSNFTLVILAIILISVMPAVIEIIRSRREKKA